eukprot:scaffold1057_cov154-Amphora_coffeaeformis.AAC.4
MRRFNPWSVAYGEIVSSNCKKPSRRETTTEGDADGDSEGLVVGVAKGSSDKLGAGEPLGFIEGSSERLGAGDSCRTRLPGWAIMLRGVDMNFASAATCSFPSIGWIRRGTTRRRQHTSYFRKIRWADFQWKRENLTFEGDLVGDSRSFTFQQTPVFVNGDDRTTLSATGRYGV